MSTNQLEDLMENIQIFRNKPKGKCIKPIQSKPVKFDQRLKRILMGNLKYRRDISYTNLFSNIWWIFQQCFLGENLRKWCMLYLIYMNKEEDIRKSSEGAHSFVVTYIIKLHQWYYRDSQIGGNGSVKHIVYTGC